MKTKITHNLSIKMLSLLVALVAWITIINVTDPTITKVIKDIPVTAINSNAVEGYCYSIESDQNIEVIVKGKKSIVDNMDVSDIKAEADLGKISVTKAVPVTVSFLHNYKQEPQIVKGNNEMIKLSLEKKVTEKFDVQVKFKGTTPAGHYVSSSEVTLNYDSIKISGPETLIGDIYEVIVEVDVSDAEEKFSRRAQVKAVDEKGDDIDTNGQLEYSKDFIYVTVEPLIEKELDVKVQISGNVAEGYAVKNIENTLTSIIVAGDESSMAASKTILITVDVEKASSNIEKEYNIVDFLSGTVKLTSSVDKAKIKVEIEKMTSKKIEFYASELKFINQKDNIYINYNGNTALSVTVKGLREKVEDIEIADCAPYIDMEGLVVGAQKVKIQFEKINGIDIVYAPSLDINIANKSSLNTSHIDDN